ncbi:MAG TPA: MFS transporter [Steroidobacteraceae bacterium]|nr:MFS transporter [Steroidobacteraceae bacterium]
MDGIVFEQRRNTLIFWCGCALVTAGVLAHLPMFLMGRATGFVLAGMPMGFGMLLGMAAIVLGVGAAAYGLLPAAPRATSVALDVTAPLESARLGPAHWRVAGLLALALVIDIMKPASLGFVTPGMKSEYHVGAQTVAWLPFAALAGTVVGSVVWGVLADVYGRRASIVLSSVMFVGTSICGAMPDFWWNVGMCFMMGAAAGGMLPVAYALLAEVMPTRHRGWSLVLVGGVGALGGFFAASFLSALLQPTFGWRIMWLLNLPTGLLLVVLSPLLPESARFLQETGRSELARVTLARFGVVLAPAATRAATVPHESHAPVPPLAHGFLGITAALTLAALAWGMVNFGLLLWLPSALVAQGRSVAASSALIAKSTLLAAPTIVVCAWLFSAWSTKWSLIAVMGVMVLGLAGLTLPEVGSGGPSGPVVPLALVILGSCGVIAMLLPYAAENYPLLIRGRATGWVAACSKFGGLAAQTLSVLGGVPSLTVVILFIAAPAVVASLLIALFGHETRGRGLGELDLAHRIGSRDST